MINKSDLKDKHCPYCGKEFENGDEVYKFENVGICHVNCLEGFYQLFVIPHLQEKGLIKNW